jgi:hypothetical protein
MEWRGKIFLFLKITDASAKYLGFFLGLGVTAPCGG